MTVVYLRLFAEVSADRATTIAAAVRDILVTTGARVRVASVTPYWKIPEYQEILLELQVDAEPAEGVSSSASALGTAWTWQSPTEAMWNAGDGHEFCERTVRWAHLESP